MLVVLAFALYAVHERYGVAGWKLTAVWVGAALLWALVDRRLFRAFVRGRKRR